MCCSEYEIYEKLLEMGFTEEELEKELKRKANEYGGFMSEEAILFLIAKENGININSPDLESEEYKEYNENREEIDYDEFTINISDLEEGMQQIVLIGKILKVFPPREFIRKDSSMGRVGSFYIADTTGKMKIVVWNEKTELMNNEYFTIDQLIRIIGGFSKSNKDGVLEVHLGKKGEIILAPQDISKKKREELNVIILKEIELEKQRKNDMQLYDLISRYSFIKKAQGNIKVENFREIVNKNGEKTFLLKCIFSDNSMSIRLVVWGMNAVRMFKLVQDGDYVVFQNLAVKENKYTNEKELVYTQKSSLEIL
jgi:replication factor A1